MTIFLQEIDKLIFECINNTAKGYAKNCARNAISHLECAWKIKDIDPKMAIFRTITAEEEAATAIFIALKEKGYENADKIKFKKHTYKQALAPFITGMSKFVDDVARQPNCPLGRKYKLSIESEGKNQRLVLYFCIQGQWNQPIPPLNFLIMINGKPYYFKKELLEITSGQNRDDIIRHIDDLTKLRNSLLYARPEGILKIIGQIDGHLEKRRRTVMTFLKIFSLIYPYKEKALFVEQALKAYLLMMGEIEDIVEDKE